ncbi:hypothetical protein OBV_16910 [Oscillibacter valericigenes Sjm18-20]|nr:hypothetical protein OBV_16910 [Oscillibacter valericigenes Sjm18-20]
MLFSLHIDSPHSYHPSLKVLYYTSIRLHQQALFKYKKAISLEFLHHQCVKT